jgi:hypothetical protein
VLQAHYFALELAALRTMAVMNNTGLVPSCPPHRSAGLDVLFPNCRPKKKPQGRSKKAQEVKSRVKKSKNKEWEGFLRGFLKFGASASTDKRAFIGLLRF